MARSPDDERAERHAERRHRRHRQHGEGRVPGLERQRVVAFGQRRHQVDDDAVGQRARDREHEGEPRRGEEGAPERPRRRLVGEAEARRRLLGRRAGVALAVGHALAALQRRGVAELAEIADRRADLQHALLADIGVAADADRVEVDAVAVGRIARHERAAHDDRVLADLEQVGRDRRHDARDGSPRCAPIFAPSRRR